MAGKIRLAILDHFQSNIDGYLYRLDDEPDFEIVTSGIYANEVETILTDHEIDVLLLGANVPISPKNKSLYPLSEKIPELLQEYRNLVILVIAMYPQGEFIARVMKAGASGYICKDDSEAIKALGSIIRSVIYGGCYISQTAHQNLFTDSVL
jgi:DNA-binding NarL/FixJ family response regulator